MFRFHIHMIMAQNQNQVRVEAAIHVYGNDPTCTVLNTFSKTTLNFPFYKPRSRFLPPYVKLSEEIASGSSIGRVTHVAASLGHVITIPRLFKKELGGGSMLDLGVYAVFLILQVRGKF